MQNQAMMAYQQAAKQTVSPRHLEASLLTKAAVRLQRVYDNWETDNSDIAEALLFNQKLWQVFLVSITAEEHPLPDSIRENVANLGIFVMAQIMEFQELPNPGKLLPLININKELAQGLRVAAAAATPTPPATSPTP